MVLLLGLVLFSAFPGRLFGEAIQAVFFDLGDTLVEDVGGGMFGLRPGAAETVTQLQALGVELGIITNVPAGWTREDLEAILVEPEGRSVAVPRVSIRRILSSSALESLLARHAEGCLG